MGSPGEAGGLEPQVPTLATAKSGPRPGQASGLTLRHDLPGLES